MPVLTVGLLVAYGGSLRYLTIRRSDQARRSQFVTFFFTPVAMLWSAFVIGPLRWYCLFLTLFGRAGGTKRLYVHREVSVPATAEREDLVYASTGAAGSAVRP